MASSSRGVVCARLLLVQVLLALAVLHSVAPGVEALPITSRPIEGNAQRDAWEAWLRLPFEQQALEKQKKVMPKSIFALPFTKCPPNHKRYNDRCIPETKIDPTDLIAQELLGQLGAAEGVTGPGNSPIIFTDYDYSESDSQSDEQLFGPLIQTVPLAPLLPTSSGAEDQALPSEDAPLKFNIFEKKFPTGPDTDVTVSSTGTSTTPATVTSTATTTPTPTPTIATMREQALKTPSNRIAEAAEDLQADSSNALPSTTSLSIASGGGSTSGSSRIGAFSNLGQIDAIVVSAGIPLDSEPTVQLVTSSTSGEQPQSVANADAKSDSDADADADADAGAQLDGEAEADAEADVETETETETDLAQLLKADAFLPAYAGVDTMPPFSHRRVSPLLSADLDADDAATDVAETEADTTTATAAATATATESTAATTSEAVTPTTATLAEEEQELDAAVLKKSKVQPVQPSSTTTATTAAAAATATTVATTTAATATTVSLTSTTKATAATATAASASPVTTTTTTAATVAGELAAIHQDANGKARDDDRFYYQPFASSSSSSSSVDSGSIADGDLDVLNDMASSDNLMTNTIGGRGEGERAASEINFEQELRIINELVKDKRRISQLRQQQESTTTTTTTAATISESSSEASSTPATGAAAETTNFWPSLMPMWGQSSTEATSTATTGTAAIATAATTTTTAATTSTTSTTSETITTTAATPTATTFSSNVADSSTATATATSTATATATATVADSTSSTQHLSINTNRSNRNSKIIRVDSIEPTAAAAGTATAAASAATADGSYTPFWWLPNIGWRVDRQVDEQGEDRSLLLRFFRTFRASDSSLSGATSAT